MTLNFDRLKIIYNNKTELIIRKTIIGQLLVIGGALLSIVIGGFIINSIDNIGNVELIIIWAVLASILYNSYKPIKTIISKEQFSFDLTSQTIYYNNDLKTTFSEVEFIEIVNISGGEGGSDSYLLNLRLKDKSSIQIDDNPNGKETRKVAGEIGTFINKEIKSK
ncbi:MAG: hypothetical protein V4547_14655 [Bacteroidota bacterium]